MPSLGLHTNARTNKCGCGILQFVNQLQAFIEVVESVAELRVYTAEQTHEEAATEERGRRLFMGDRDL